LDPSTAERPGRNDPCHCGSGRKYKQCCLDKDEAAVRAARAKTAEAAGAPAASAVFARAARTAASSLSRQHCLYLRPEPQWQGSLRPGRSAVDGSKGASFSSHFTTEADVS